MKLIKINSFGIDIKSMTHKSLPFSLPGKSVISTNSAGDAKLSYEYSAAPQSNKQSDASQQLFSPHDFSQQTEHHSENNALPYSPPPNQVLEHNKHHAFDVIKINGKPSNNINVSDSNEQHNEPSLITREFDNNTSQPHNNFFTRFNEYGFSPESRPDSSDNTQYKYNPSLTEADENHSNRFNKAPQYFINNIIEAREFVNNSEQSNLEKTTVNYLPTGEDKHFIINEDTAYTFNKNDFGFQDPNTGDTLQVVRINSVPTQGLLKLNNVNVNASDIITITEINSGHLVFEPGANDNGVNYSEFSFRVRDNISYSSEINTISFDVTAIDDPPTLTNVDNTTFNEASNGDNTIILDASVSLADVDSNAVNNSILQINIDNQQNGEVLSISTTAANSVGNVKRTGNNVEYFDVVGWIVVGTVGTGNNQTGIGETLEITFNNNSSYAIIERVIENINYTSNLYNQSQRTVEFLFTGSDNQSTGQITQTLTINEVANDLTLTAGNDNFSTNSGSFSDTFTTDEADFSANDIIAAGLGDDWLVFNDTANITAAELVNKTGIDVIQFDGFNNTLVITDAFVNSSDNNSVRLHNASFFSYKADTTITSLDTSGVTAINGVLIDGGGQVTLADGVNNKVSVADNVRGHIVGGTGADTIHGGSGRDALSGGDGDDIIHGQGNDDQLEGQAGQDTLTGGAGADKFIWNDLTHSTAGNADSITDFSEAHSDKIQLTFNDTIIISGSGNLATTFSNQAGEIIANGNTIEIDSNGNGSADFAINLNVAASSLELDDFIFHNVTGSSGADTLTGSALNDTISGGDNNDTLTGKAGNDTLNGNDGNDILVGGYGSDILNGGAGNDIIYADDRHFDPNSIANLQLWLDGSDPFGDGRLVADGTAISTWFNKANSSVDDFTQTTANFQPVFDLDGLNGRPAVSFDGIDDYFEQAYNALLNGNASTVFVLSDTDGGAGSYRSPITSRDIENSVIEGFAFYATNSNRWQVWGGNSAGGWGLEGNDAVVLSTPKVLELKIDGTNFSVVADGHLEGSYSTYQPNTEESIRVAAGNNEGSPLFFFNGDIADILIYNRALTDDESELVEHYLAYQSGVTVDDTPFGSDTLTGGSGADIFSWSNSSHSALGSEDSITDFSESDSDKIEFTFDDFIQITGAGTLATSFSNQAGELIANGNFLQIDWEGDGVADFSISLNVAANTLELDDFIFHNVIGSASNETFTGSSLDDKIDGGAGADILNGNLGDDILFYDNADLITASAVNGGAGIDTLKVDGNAISLDLTAIDNTYITDIERIDLTGSGDNTLTLDANDVLDISSTVNYLYLEGNSGDTVNLNGGGWSTDNTINNGTAGLANETYILYVNGSSLVYANTDLDVNV